MSQFLWTQRQDMGPAGRAASAMAFDQERKRIVLFGGTPSDAGTWEWDGQYWTQVSDMGPPSRSHFGMAWDSASKQVLLFGGQTVIDPVVLLGDTWEWDGMNWTQVDDTGPATRASLAVATDTTRNQIVLFGGGGSGGPLGDTWEWDGTAWTQLEETGPIARAGHSMTFDSVRGRTVLFGGTKIDGTAQGDTWEWTGTAWIQVSEFGPGHRLSAAMSFDGSQSLLFGGLQFLSGPPGDTMGDTWSWDGRFWTQRQDIGPQPRTLHAMAFDSARKKTVLFGGAGPGRTFADTWEFSQRT